MVMDGRPKSIVELPALIRGLCDVDCRRWRSMYDLQELTGGCNVPEEFIEKIRKWFGQDSDANPEAAALERVQKQRVLSVFNKHSCEEVRFNSLRVSRPQPVSVASTAQAALASLEQLYASTGGEDKCDFCAWKTRTASDVWGRVFGKAGCITASNVAKANEDHGVVILPGHHPLRSLSVDVVVDVFETAHSWAQNCVLQRAKAAEAHDAGNLCYPQLLWNCGMGSGATQPHGHAQVILSFGRAAGRAEAARRAAEAHRVDTGKDFWEEVLWCHQAAGLAVSLPGAAAAHVAAHVTPLASRELLVFGQSVGAVGQGVHFATQVLQDRFQARCFNISCALPPLEVDGGPADQAAERPSKRQRLQEQEKPSWIVARILDQTDKPTSGGNLYGATFATFELYGPTVDDFDPYRTVHYLHEAVQSL